MLKAQGSETEGKRQLPVCVGQYVPRVTHYVNYSPQAQ